MSSAARGELGMRPLQNLSVFAFAEKTNADWQAGLGARLTW